jgi:hypothetical protein
MDSSVRSFYQKEGRLDYFHKYEEEHGARLDFCVRHFALSEVKNSRIADYGCGYGFLLRRLNRSNECVGFDGAHIDLSLLEEHDFALHNVDLNTPFSSEGNYSDYFYHSFCFETLEHLENPYRCVVEMKVQAQLHSRMYISIPHIGMTHNTIYPGLIYPETNFEEFLWQMALPIEDKVLFDIGWPSWVYCCRNEGWAQARMKFYKPQFVGKNPVEHTNL